MKIIYIHQYFLTPEQGGAIRSYYLAKSLVEQGHDVELITTHNSSEYKEEFVEGIKVHYLPIFYDNHLRFYGRLKSFIKYAQLAYKKAASLNNVDLCYASSTPLTVGLIALMLKWRKKIPYYFEVRDLWPEAPIQMGFIKNFFVKKLLYKLERVIYRSAEKIIALSPGMMQGVEKHVTNKPILIIPNMSDCEFFKPEVKRKEIEKKYGVEGKFVVTYFGAIGKVNHLDFFMEAVKESKKYLKEVAFLIAGKGSELDRMKALAVEYKLSNLKFINFMNKEGIKELMNITDATYISFAQKPILDTNSPNKFFDSIAAGKLCIINTKGWIKELLEEEHCGFYTNPLQPDDFVRKITPFVKDKELLLKQQQNARKLAEQYFSKELQIEKFNQLFIKDKASTSKAYTLTA